MLFGHLWFYDIISVEIWKQCAEPMKVELTYRHAFKTRLDDEVEEVRWKLDAHKINTALWNLAVGTTIVSIT